MEEFLLVTDETAQTLGYRNRHGLYRDIREGHFPAFVRIGGKIRIPVSALKRWTEKQLAENERRANARADAA